MKHRLAFLFAYTFFLPATGLSEVLLIDAVAAEQQADVPRPHRGEITNVVEQRFGSPLNRHAPVGAPPITRWDYAQFSVYFEYDHVITSVLKRNKAAPQ